MRWLLLLSLFLLVPLANTLRAQEEFTDDPFVEDPAPDEPWRVPLDKLTLRLSLTDAQIPAAEALLAEYYTNLSANPPATPEDKKIRKRALRARFQQLLTPEQQAKLRSGRKPAAAGNQQQKKRGWLDALIDDVATPLLENRKRNRRKGG